MFVDVQTSCLFKDDSTFEKAATQKFNVKTKKINVQEREKKKRFSTKENIKFFYSQQQQQH